MTQTSCCLAKLSDLKQLVAIDRHLSEKELNCKIEQKEILLCKKEKAIVGILRFGKFWDLLPFINWMWVHEEHRRKGVGSALIEELIEITSKNGAEAILTSTQADEEAQHFYRRLGFKDIGGFVLKGEPLELVMVKYVNTSN